MQRREFITLIGGAAAGWPLAARAQQAARTYRVASAWVATEATVRSLEQAFLAVLAERGYVVGRNLLYESRYANGEPTRLPALVDELIAFRPDVLAGIEPVVRVMMSKTSTVPIVMTNASDPVAAGLVNSLSKPGGNVTGVSFQYDELGPKLIELTRENTSKPIAGGPHTRFHHPWIKGRGSERAASGAKIGDCVCPLLRGQPR